MSDKEKSFFVYILECENGNYYTGYTIDIHKRFNVHKTGAGQGAKFTRSFKPSKIAAVWRISGGKSAAMKVEYFIKKHERRIKIKFINDPPCLKCEFFKKNEAQSDLDIFPLSPPVIA
jgi:putative endonuclease